MADYELTTLRYALDSVVTGSEEPLVEQEGGCTHKSVHLHCKGLIAGVEETGRIGMTFPHRTDAAVSATLVRARGAVQSTCMFCDRACVPGEVPGEKINDPDAKLVTCGLTGMMGTQPREGQTPVFANRSTECPVAAAVAYDAFNEPKGGVDPLANIVLDPKTMTWVDARRS